MSFVFVSHAAPDKRRYVRPLVQALAIEGVSLWLDRPGSGPDDFQLPPEFVSRHQIQSLRLGQDWDEGIKSALLDAGAVLICLSKAALEPGREVLLQEMWGAQLNRKAVTCIVDDLDLSAMPQERGLLSLGRSQALRIDAETLGLAIDWLSADTSRTPDQLPKAFQLAWQDVRRLRDELHRTRDEAHLAVQPSGRYRWPTPWDFSGYIADKREAFGGRDWLLAEIAAWLGAGHPRALLVRADFGVGKSAMMAELVQRNPGGAIVACHFCQRDTQVTLEAGPFVLGIAAQLAVTLPAYRALIESEIGLQQRLALAAVDAGSAFEGAVLAPLMRIPAPAAARVLLVDALDEALELNDSDGLRGGTIVGLLAAKARRFPPWLLVLATTRPHPQVLVPLQHAFASKEIDAESAANLADLSHYVLDRAQREPLLTRLRNAGRTPEQLATLLAARSQGKFLYAVRALSDLEGGRLSLDAIAALPPGLDSFYLDAFERRFGVGRYDYDEARSVLGILAAARDPLPPAVVAEVLGCSVDSVRSVQQLLPDFLRLRGGRLAFDHLSLAEWLTQEDADGVPRAGRYCVERDRAEQRLQGWARARVQAGSVHESDYLLRHLGAHLPAADERRRVYTGLLLGSIAWWQQRLAQGGVEALLADIEQLQGDPDQPLLQMLLRHSEPLLQRWPQQLPVQLAGRLGNGLGPGLRLSALARAARVWVDAAAAPAGDGWLVPVGRSLRLAVASLKVLPSGGAELALLPDGRVGFDTNEGDICVWDPSGRRPLQTFDGHTGRVRALAVTSDGRLASGGMDAAVRIVDPQQGGAASVLTGHVGPVRALAALPGGQLASAGHDGTIRLWGARPDAALQVLQGHRGAVRALAALPDGRLVSGGSDGSLRLWQPGQDHAVAALEVGDDPVRKLSVWADGRVVAGTTGGLLHVWDAGREARALTLSLSGTGAVRSLLALPGGRLVSGHDDGSVRLWTPATGDSVKLGWQAGFVRALALLADGRIVSGATDGSVQVWDPSGREPPLPLAGHSGWIDALLPLPDGRLVSCANDGVLRYWDPRIGVELPAPAGHVGCVRAVAALSDGCFVSAGDDPRAWRWHASRADAPTSWHAGPAGLRALCLRADGCLVGLSHDGQLVVWNEQGLPALQDVPLLGAEAQQLAAMPDGRLAATAADGRLLFWDPRGGSDPLLMEVHTRPLRVLAALPDGRLASGTRDGQVCLWDLRRSNAPLAELNVGPLRALAGLPDGRLMVGADDGSVRLHDVVGFASPLVLPRHTGWVVALAVRPDGWVASGASDGTVRLWHPSRTGAQHLFVADAGVTALAAAGDIVAAACEDGTVHLLRAAGAVASFTS